MRRQKLNPINGYANYFNSPNEYSENYNSSITDIKRKSKVNKLFDNRVNSKSRVEIGNSSLTQNNPSSLLERDLTPVPSVRRYLPIIPK